MCEWPVASDPGPSPNPTRTNLNFHCSHDEVLADLGLTGTRFTVKYQDQVIAMTRAFLDFMKSLRLRAPEAVNPVTRTAVGTDVEAWSEPNSDVEADETTCDIKLTDEGFPVLPIAIIKRELTKSECERLVRAYLSHHYCKILCVQVSSMTKLTDISSGKRKKFKSGSVRCPSKRYVSICYRGLSSSRLCSQRS
jgi:hypothetical protein